MIKYKKSDNSHIEEKLALRREVLLHLSAPYHVLDCCAGAGHIWSELRKEFDVKSYLPIDKNPRLSGSVKMDSRKALSCMDISGFTVFDIDTYGEPWRHWLIVARKIVGPAAVFLTHGHMGDGPANLSNLAKKAMNIPHQWRIPQVGLLQQLSASYLLFGCDNVVVNVGKVISHRRVNYYGLLIRPKEL